MATRLRQSASDFEQAFVEQIHSERKAREDAQFEVMAREHQRHIDRVHKHATIRFLILVLVLAGTVVATTVGMFQLLLLVMG